MKTLVILVVMGVAIATQPTRVLADNRVTCDAKYEGTGNQQTVQLSNCKPEDPGATIGDGLTTLAWAVGVVGVIWGISWGGGALIKK